MKCSENCEYKEKLSIKRVCDKRVMYTVECALLDEPLCGCYNILGLSGSNKFCPLEYRDAQIRKLPEEDLRKYVKMQQAHAREKNLLNYHRRINGLI